MSDVGDNSKISYRIVSENSYPLGGKLAFLTDKQYLFSRNKDKHFMIDRVTGEISVAKPLKPNFEYALNISAADRGGLRSYTGIRIIVEGKFYTCSHFFSFSRHRFNVPNAHSRHQQYGPSL